MAMLGVRCSTVSVPAWEPQACAICTPEAPVPMMAQRLPSTGMLESGQNDEWCISPLKVSMPGQAGMYRREACSRFKTLAQSHG